MELAVLCFLGHRGRQWSQFDFEKVVGMYICPGGRVGYLAIDVI